MPSDLELLEQLEKEIGTKLPRRDFDKIMRYERRGYSTDRQGRVNGLNLTIVELKAIPSVVARFRYLERLRLYDTQISDLTPLARLTNLTELYLEFNQINDLIPLSRLINLEKLYLIGNKITNLTPLSGLTNLSELYLNKNQIRCLTPLAGMMDLKDLFLGENQISDITPLTGLTNLGFLDLSYNKITALPPQILDLDLEINVENDIPFADKLYLHGNPLEKPPPEIIKQGKDAVRAYFQALEKEEHLPLQQAKILLVGDGGAGKTSLVKRMLGLDFDPKEDQTHGINIRKWVVTAGENEIIAHLWDFGGQEIMHATHQFFLSKRSLYILVLDGRRDEKTEYWLKLIESFGGDSPVLVVLNKMDQNPGFDINRNFLQQKYKNIKGFFRLSCANTEGIKPFVTALVDELAKVELIHTTWPKSWFEIKEKLEHMPQHFINRTQYEEICRKAKIKDKTKRDTLLEFLNDLGVVLHFKDFELQDTHVLEPEWVTGAVYKIINSPELAETQGELELAMLDTILEKKAESDYDYPPEQYRFIIGLMEKFELCYPLVKSIRVLVPDLLAVQEPDVDFDYDTALRFIVEYDFLPRSVMPRFIVNMYRDIKQNLQWRTGVVLEDRDFEAQALVRADNEARRIYIYVAGNQKRDYFAALLLTLRRINSSFEKLKTSELVPMPDNPEITAPYKQLVKCEKKGYEYYLHAESDKEYLVKDLLGTIIGEKAATEEEILRYLKEALAAAKDTKESPAKILKDTLILQPNIFGVGINISKIFDKLLSRQKKGDKTN